jgi:hypothetical protein
VSLFVIFGITIQSSKMKFISVLTFFLFVISCKEAEVAPRNCRFVTVKEEQKNINGTAFTTVSTFNYDAGGLLTKMDVNSTNSSSSFTLNIKNDPKNIKIYEYLTSGGRLSRDTLKFDERNYRKEHIYRSSNTWIKSIYEHDSKGFPTVVTIKDFKNVLLNQYEWLNDGKNLTAYQQILGNDKLLIETYEYYTNTTNNKIYYISQFQIAKNFGRPPQELLKKVTKAGGDIYEYSDYQFDTDNNIISYLETFKGVSFTNGHTRKVSFEYFCQD